MIVLYGIPRTKKNHQAIVSNNGRPSLIQSKAYRLYQADCLKQLYQYRERYTGDVNLEARYYMKTKQRPDLVNLLQATCDILQKAGIVENDNQIVTVDGSKVMGVDKIFPRVEIIIKGVKE